MPLSLWREIILNQESSRIFIKRCCEKRKTFQELENRENLLPCALKKMFVSILQNNNNNNKTVKDFTKEDDIDSNKAH